MYYEYLVNNFGPQVKQAAFARNLLMKGLKGLGIGALGAGGLALGSQLGRINPGLQAKADATGDALSDIASKAYEGAKNTYSTASDYAGKAADKVKGKAKAVAGEAKNRADKASYALADLYTALTGR